MTTSLARTSRSARRASWHGGLTLLLASAWAGCEGMPQPPLPGDTPPEVTIRSEQGEGTATTSHSALLIESEWSYAVPGDIQRVVFMEPGGKVYQKRSTKVGPEGRVVVRLPVRGTDIDDYSMVGTWKAYLYRNNSNVPARIVTFQLER